MLAVERKRAVFIEAQNRFQKYPVQLLDQWRHRLELGLKRLELLNPRSILARGYSITLDALTQQIIRSAKTVKPGQPLLTKLADGDVISSVQKS